MILFLKSKEYFFSYLKRKLFEFDGQITRTMWNAFLTSENYLLSLFTGIHTSHEADIDIMTCKVSQCAKKILEFDRAFGTELFINSYECVNGHKIIVENDLYREFLKEYNVLYELYK
jgi:hypothetical protein